MKKNNFLKKNTNVKNVKDQECDALRKNLIRRKNKNLIINKIDNEKSIKTN